MRRLNAKLILVIDDSEDSRTLIETLFRAQGWDFYGAANGEEALSLLKELHRLPDLILLDLEMPVMNGYRFRKEQSRDERLKSIPVVVISATTDEDKVKRLCPNGTLTKPLRLKSLVARVAEFI